MSANIPRGLQVFGAVADFVITSGFPNFSPQIQLTLNFNPRLSVLLIARFILNLRELDFSTEDPESDAAPNAEFSSVRFTEAMLPDASPDRTDREGEES